jgi:hypothetical protein
MNAGPWTFYQSFVALLGNGTIDLDSDSFKVLLATSSYTPDVAAHEDLSDVSGGEVANGNGYATGGVAVTASWTRSGATATFDSDDPRWVATDSGITARYAVLYDDTADKLVAYCLLDRARPAVGGGGGPPRRGPPPGGGYFSLAPAA